MELLCDALYGTGFPRAHCVLLLSTGGKVTRRSHFMVEAPQGMFCSLEIAYIEVALTLLDFLAFFSFALWRDFWLVSLFCPALVMFRLWLGALARQSGPSQVDQTSTI